MDQQIQLQSAAGSRRPAIKSFGDAGPLVSRLLMPALLPIVIILAGLPGLRAESLASKNKEGNRLFAQGRYAEAEKAYLEAQVKNPGRPEVLYNLGNALIRQKKYDQGIQSLRQSISRGHKEIEEHGWYNSGNALYSMGKFKDSAESYIRALKLDPADRDAKHNLELALMKLKQQEQRQSDTNRKRQNGEKSQQSRLSSGKEAGQQPDHKDREGSVGQMEQKQSEKPQSDQTVPREGALGHQQAIQMLDAIQSQELKEQRKLLERRARRKADGKDW